MASIFKDADESPAFQNLRIVLLGASGVGKSATGNAILGREAFKETKTREAEIQRGRVEDKNISVIDTPGFFNTELTDEDLQNEMMKSLFLSHPGPHVFLLIINLKTIKEDDRNLVKLIQELFGEESLQFTMILFIGREDLSKREFTKLFQNKKTKEMLDCFEGKYHTMNSRNECDTNQIKKLLKNIDIMMKNNGGQHYITEIFLNRLKEEREKHLEDKLKKIREEVMEKHETVEKKKEALTKRQEEVQERQNELKKIHEDLKRQEEVRERLQEFKKIKEMMKERHNNMMQKQEELTRRQEEVKKRHQELTQRYEERRRVLQKSVRREQRRMLRPNVRIVLLGKTGSGKSSTGNTILGRDEFKADFRISFVTTAYEKQEAVVGGRIISVIDTPGMWDMIMSDRELKSEIMKCIYMSAPGPHVFLLVIRLDVRITDEEKNVVKWIQGNIGEDAVKYTIILFTHADVLKNKISDEYIKGSSHLQGLINRCGGRYHSFNNEDMKNRSQVTELLEKIDEMVESNGGEHYTNEMFLKAGRQQAVTDMCELQ